MDTLADRPAGSVIGITLSWPAPSGSQVRRYIEAAVFALWLCGWVASWWWPVGQLADGKADPGLIGLLGMWAVFSGIGVWGLWTYFRPARPESMRLEAEVLRYDPGRSPAGPPQRQWFGVNPPGLKPMQIARSAIRGFALERVDGQQRLYLDRGADRLEIGAGLRESDREWLFAVLQRWHAPNEALHRTPAAVSIAV
jgi:hypothetical protein